MSDCGKEYVFIKDYKHQDMYRKSFADLGKRIFDIDFEEFYQKGFWGDDYICYSYVHENVVISNVSLSTMELIIEGEHVRAIQIGTVMTDPLFRRKGLAYQLMTKIFEDYDPTCTLYFLAADEEAIPLYEKCGFIANPENKYIIEVSKTQRLNHELTPCQLTVEELLHLKRQAQPLSTILSAVKDEHVLLFYYMMGFKESIYRLTDELYVIYEREDSCLNLYTILSTKPFDLQEIIESIVFEGIDKVICHFTPDQEIDGLTVEIDSTSSWMIRCIGNRSFPIRARFPRISQT